MDLGELFGGLLGVLAGLVLLASFIKVGEIRTRRAVIGWNIARLVSIAVGCWWFVFWLGPRFG